MTYWASIIVSVCGLAVAAPAVAQEGGRDFRYRGWAGAPLPNDAEKGCAMGLEARGGGGFVAYANASSVFKIGIGGRDFELEPGKEGLAAVVFDDGPPIVLKGVAASKAMALFEPVDFPARGGLEPLVESSRSVRLTFAGRYLTARLSGSSRALKLLRECATAPETSEPPPASAAATDGAGVAGGGDRSAGFAFLRQGMDAAEANAKLLEAGWQAEESPATPPADEIAAPNPALEALRGRGVAAQSCDGAPPACVIAYADAYGNALKVTAAGEGDPKLKAWRLNPPDAPKGDDAGPEGR